MRHERQQTQAFTYRLLIIVIATIIGASDCLLELVAFQRGHPLLRDAPDAPEVRQLVKDCWIGVFNAGGNDYRLLTRISYLRQLLQIEQLLTHAEYSKNKWKRRYE